MGEEIFSNLEFVFNVFRENPDADELGFDADTLQLEYKRLRAALVGMTHRMDEERKV